MSPSQLQYTERVQLLYDLVENGYYDVVYRIPYTWYVTDKIIVREIAHLFDDISNAHVSCVPHNINTINLSNV